MININATLDTDEKHMVVEGELNTVTDHRSFDDFGGTLESFKIVNAMGHVRVLHSNDDALSFFTDEHPPRH
jgi:hypothetical protein